MTSSRQYASDATQKLAQAIVVAASALKAVDRSARTKAQLESASQITREASEQFSRALVSMEIENQASPTDDVWK